MIKSASNKTMEDFEKLFGKIKQVEVPASLYGKIEIRFSKDKIVYVPGRIVRFAAAAIFLLITSETIIVVSDMKSRKNVSSLVGLPDNSLNYE